MLYQHPAPIQPIHDPYLEEKGIQLYIKREDLIHPEVSGNKWRKLKYNLERAKELGHQTLLTFGGAYSNHIYAVAAAGKVAGFKTIGVIRGEETLPLNPTLSYAHQQGMQFHYVSRTAYRNKKDDDMLIDLQERFGAFYPVPEGGTNLYAVKGCVEIVSEFDQDYDYVCTASGTGGTLAGLVCGMNGKGKLLGFSALKGGEFLNEEVSKLVHQCTGRYFDNWEVVTEYHFGGYAKFRQPLIDFINSFKQNHAIQLDPVYTGKMMYGIYDMIAKGAFPKGSKILAIHTGGLQGIAGFNERYGNLIRV